MFLKTRNCEKSQVSCTLNKKKYVAKLLVVCSGVGHIIVILIHIIGLIAFPSGSHFYYIYKIHIKIQYS